mgnify:CR=1 FL=1
MVWTFGEKGHPIDTGFDMLIYGTIPDASGLSSSSSVHMLTAVALRDMYGVEGVSNIDIALYPLGSPSANSSFLSPLRISFVIFLHVPKGKALMSMALGEKS